jgi:hypothetical protein
MSSTLAEQTILKNAAPDPAAHPVVEEYQMTFFCDNLLLLGVTSEITLKRSL